MRSRSQGEAGQSRVAIPAKRRTTSLGCVMTPSARWPNSSPPMSKEKKLSNMRSSGADEALRSVSARVPVALSTMKKWQFARKLVEAFGWGGLFTEVLGSEEGFPAKPDPAMLLELCRRLAVPPGEVLYVGDTSMDAAMAASAHTPFAFAAYGYGTADSVSPFPRAATSFRNSSGVPVRSGKVP